MKSADIQVFHGAGRPFELRSIPLPACLQEDEVLVEISLATICGSDLHTLEGRRCAPAPCVLGHEAVGVVVASRRSAVHPGQRVTWSLADSCGTCPSCTQFGLPQKCVSLFKYGHASLVDGTGLNGCYASHILLRRNTAIFEVPDKLADSIAAPANCALATIVSALDMLPVPCRSALVQGGGMLGLYACAVLSRRGVRHIYCSDIDARRLSLIPEFGGVAVRVDPASWPESLAWLLADSSGGVDLVLEVAGTAAVVPQGLQALRPGGCYVWAGMVHPATALSITGEDIVKKCLKIRGVHNYAPPDLGKALAILSETQGEFPYHKLVSPPVALKKLSEAMAMARSHEWLRVSVQP